MNRTLRLTLFLTIVAAMAATASILTLGPRLASVPHLPDTGAAWYYWKLPEPTAMARLTAWGFYAAHLLFWWGLIRWAQKNRARLVNRNSLHGLNLLALGGMGFFIALHYLQTAIWYDGLAADTSVFSSQGSVILLLVVVLMIEAPRRGLVFGAGGRRFTPIRPWLIRWHGYYFAWAVTYTFWFHPMETTAGHLLGFFYTFLLMAQGALIFTRIHTNRWWTGALELLVLFHAVVVAWVAGQDLWPMFLFGFAAIFVMTQMHGLGLPKWLRWVIGLGFVGGVTAIYSDRGLLALNEVLRIPVIDYLLAVVLGWIVWRLTRQKPT